MVSATVGQIRCLRRKLKPLIPELLDVLSLRSRVYQRAACLRSIRSLPTRTRVFGREKAATSPTDGRKNTQ